MNSLWNKKAKLFVILGLVMVIAGMALLGFLGLNNTVDYSESYEVQVSVDHNKDGEAQIMFDATEKFFANKGIKNVCYSVQKLNDGATLVYKFTEDVTDKVQGLDADIQNALGTDTFAKASVQAFEVKGQDNQSVVYFVIAIAVALVAIFVYAGILEKLAGALATLVSGALASIIALSLVAITRLPASPFLFITMAIATIASTGISLTLVNKFRSEIKNQANAKLNKYEVADLVVKTEKKRLIYLFAIFALITIALVVLGFVGMPYAFFVAGHILIAGLSAICVSMISTPLIWSAIAKN